MEERSFRDGYGWDGRMGPPMMMDGRGFDGGPNPYWRGDDECYDRMDGECRHEGECDGKMEDGQMKRGSVSKRTPSGKDN